VGRVSGEKHPAKPHGLCDKASHSGDTFLRDRSYVWLPSIVAFQASEKLIPDSIVRPFRNIFIRRALQIESRDGIGTHAKQREAALVQAIDKFRR